MQLKSRCLTVQIGTSNLNAWIKLLILAWIKVMQSFNIHAENNCYQSPSYGPVSVNYGPILAFLHSNDNVPTHNEFRGMLTIKISFHAQWLHVHYVQQKSRSLNFVRSAPEVALRTDAIIIRVVLLSPYLCIRGVSLSSIHYNQSRRVYINQRHQYICLIWI